MLKSINKMLAINSELNFVVSSIEGNIACGKSTILDYIASKNNRDIHCMQEPVAEWQNMSSGTDILKLFYDESDKWSFSFENLVQLSRLKSLYESQAFVRARPSDAALCTAAATASGANRLSRMKIFLERSILSSYHVFVKNSLEEKRINRIEYDILTKYYQFFTQKANRLVPSSEFHMADEGTDAENVENSELRRRNHQHHQHHQHQQLNQLNQLNHHHTHIPFQVVYVRTSPEVCFSRLQRRSRSSEHSIDLAYLTRIHAKYEAWIDALRKENPGFVRIVDGNQDKALVIGEVDQIIHAS